MIGIGKWLPAVVLAAALSGCAAGADTLTASAPQAVDEVDDMVVHVVPVALNWDERPGPDGLDVSVYMYLYARKLPVTVKGTLAFEVYEGGIQGPDLATARPFFTWRFDADALQSYLGRSAAGWGYAIRLGWGPRSPATSSVTLAARYVPGKGRTIYTRPITIAARPE
ncbi:hypothetical protein LCGC14_1433920 [marine sediment metagenome]|uniref:Uncharacterized protein n=1 Tax=marine sediment metagenome TaxID=412755 RepID=A0A0F9JN68_9ZZZZ